MDHSSIVTSHNGLPTPALRLMYPAYAVHPMKKNCQLVISNAKIVE